MTRPLTKSLIIETFLSILAAEIGVRESNDNSGVRVKEYQAATTLGGTHWPWCAALIAYAIKETEKRLGIDIPWSFSASCDVLLADGKARGILRTKPSKGDIMLVRARVRNGYSKSDMIHTGGVSSVAARTYHSIEGNTNNDGGREGVAVIEHERPISERYYFLSWIDGVDLPKAPDAPVYSVVLRTINNATAIASVMFGGTTYIKIGDVAAALGASLAWDALNGVVIFSGEEIGLQPRFVDGRAYFGARELCAKMGWNLGVDVAARKVVIEVSK